MIEFLEEDYKIMSTPRFTTLAKKHWLEIGGFNKTKFKLNINLDMYKTLGENNSMRMFTVRDCGLLVGYCFFIVTPHPHYMDTIIAENDSLYLSPEYRKGFTGYKFIKYCVDRLKSEVDIILLSMKASASFEKITQRLGFSLLDYKFMLEV